MLIKENPAWIPIHSPINIINRPAIYLKLLGAMIVESHPPITTATRVEQTNAIAAPIKTTTGCPDCAVKSSVATWVLSPSSARKTVVKVIRTTDRKSLPGISSEELTVGFWFLGTKLTEFSCVRGDESWCYYWINRS